MAIAFVRATEGTTLTTTLTFNIEVSSGSNRALVVGFSYKSNTPAVPVSIVFNSSEAFTLVKHGTDAGDAQCSLYVLTAPTETTADVVITMAKAMRMVGYVVYFTGVHQTTPFTPATADAQGSDNKPTVDVSSAADEMCVDILAQVSNGPHTATAYHTEICNGAALGGGTDCRGAGQYVVGQATRSMSWDMSGSDDWNIVAGALQEAVSVTPKSVSDAGSGADAISLIAKIPVADSGAGVDAIADLINSFTLADAGNGTDLVSILAELSVLDAGAGADLVTALGKILATDAGSGADLISILAKLSVLDSGIGTDLIAVLGKFLVADAGSGTDLVTALNKILVADSGSGVDLVAVLGKILVSDSGIGADVITLLAKIPVADSGSGVDAASVKAYITITDSGAGVETVSIQIKVPVLVADSGAGTDLVNILAKLSILDSGAGADLANILAKLSVLDSGTGVDLVSILAALSILDTGSGADLVSVQSGGVPILVTDTGAGADQVATKVLASITDTGSGVETLTINVTLSVLDSGAGADVVSVQTGEVQKLVTDSGVGVDIVAQILNRLALSDVGSGIDLVSFIVKIPGEQQYVKDGLICYWKLDETGGVVLVDNEGNVPMNLLGNYTLGVGGKRNTAVEWEDDNVTYAKSALSPPTIMSLTAFSVEFWVKAYSWNSPAQGLVEMYGSTHYFPFMVRFGPQTNMEKLMFLVEAFPGSITWIGANDDSELNTFYHVICTWDSSDKKLKMYINKALQDDIKTTTTDELHYTPSMWLWFACTAYLARTDLTFDGVLDEIRMYDRALTQAEVDQNFDVTEGKFESGTGADVVSTLGKILATDSGSGADLATALGKVLTADAGSGADVIALLAKILATDSGSGADIASIFAKISMLDSGVGADLISTLFKKLATDSGSAIDTVSIIELILKLLRLLTKMDRQFNITSHYSRGLNLSTKERSNLNITSIIKGGGE